MALTVLVIDDEENMRWVLKRALEKSGYVVLTANRGEQGLKLFARHPVDLVLLDLKMQGMDGLSVLRELRQRSADVPILLLTAYASVPTAVESLKIGATDYVRKPFDLEDVLTRISRTLYSQDKSKADEDTNAVRPGFQSFIGASPTLNHSLALAATAAETDYTVLIQGESGSGRRHLAKLIHQNCPVTCNGSLVAFDCASLPLAVLEQELLDAHPNRSGNQSSAEMKHRGRWQQALGGSLLLANINALPEMLLVPVVKHLSEYLRTLQQPHGLRLLLTTVHPMCGTWKPLLETAICVELPPLRQRLDDLHFLLAHFTPEAEWNQEAQRRLTVYGWPGNIGELKQIAQQIAFVADHRKIEVSHLPRHILASGAARVEQPHLHASNLGVGSTTSERIVLPAEGIDLDALEKNLICQALEMASGNKTQAARLLGLTRAKFLYRIDKHGLSESDS